MILVCIKQARDSHAFVFSSSPVSRVSAANAWNNDPPFSDQKDDKAKPSSFLDSGFLRKPE